MLKRMTRILIRKGAEPWVSVFLFKAVVQAVLLCDSETWVVTPHMGRLLRGFQDQVAQWMTGWLAQQKNDGKWEYISAATAREDEGLQIMDQCIRQLQNTAAQ